MTVDKLCHFPPRCVAVIGMILHVPSRCLVLGFLLQTMHTGVLLPLPVEVEGFLSLLHYLNVDTVPKLFFS